MSGSPPTPEQVRQATLTRVQSTTAVFASDQQVFRYDDRSSRTFTGCDGTVRDVSPTSAGLRAVLAHASADARFDFGSSHFAARLEDSLELKSEIRAVNGMTVVAGFGLRSGDRAFSAKFFGAWLDDGALFVNETTLTVRDERGQPDGLGTVFDASAPGVANPTPATGHAV